MRAFIIEPHWFTNTAPVGGKQFTHRPIQADGCAPYPKVSGKGTPKYAIPITGCQEKRGLANTSEGLFLTLLLIRREMVGETRFELATPCTQNRCATRLRHSPTPALSNVWRF